MCDARKRFLAAADRKADGSIGSLDPVLFCAPLRLILVFAAMLTAAVAMRVHMRVHML